MVISKINIIPWILQRLKANMGIKRRRKNYGVETAESAGNKAVGTSPGPYHTQKFAWDPFGTWPSYKVERIHHVMLVRGESRYHVQWQGIPESGMTWEPARNLQDDDSRALLEIFNAERATLESVRGLVSFMLIMTQSRVDGG